MALEGSLKEFSLADILQLLFFQKKTGALELTGRFDKVRLLFVEGNIIGAESRKRDTENRLGRVLVKRGILTQEQVDAAVEKQREEGGKFGAVLVREGFATPEQIKEVITFQTSETLTQLFNWKEGKYEFKPMRIPVDKEIGIELNTEHYLMEGVRIVDEWSEIEDKVSIETIFVPQEVSSPVELTEEEQRVMENVDGTLDVASIADVTGIDSFQVSTILLKLKEKKLVAKKAEAGEEEEIEEAKPPAKPIPGLSGFISVLVLAAMIVAMGSYIIAPSNKKAANAWEEIQVLRERIQTEYYRTSSYPKSIDETDPWGTSYFYQVSTDGFTIRSAGPDGQMNTPDDIR